MRASEAKSHVTLTTGPPATVRGYAHITIYRGDIWNQDIDFTGALGLPVAPGGWEFSARYQFRPNWAFRYSVLGFEANSSGMGDNWWAYGYGLNTKWNHYYHRLGIVYDAIRNCKAKVSVFADWVHTDDTLSINCNVCGISAHRKWGKNGDSMMAGLELQRCIRTFANGGTFSMDCRAGAIFLDNVEGSDARSGRTLLDPPQLRALGLC